MRVWAVKSFHQQWKKKNNPASKQCFDEFPQGTAGNGGSDAQDWAQKPALSDLSAVLQQDSVGLASLGWSPAARRSGSLPGNPPAELGLGVLSPK